MDLDPLGGWPGPAAIIAQIGIGVQMAWRSKGTAGLPVKGVGTVVALSLDEREKPGFLLIGGGHLSGLSLSRVTKFCTATEKPGFCSTLLQP